MRDRHNAKPGRAFATFLCCTLGVPTCVKLMPGLWAADMMAALAVGVLLGMVYIVMRPILRLITMPLGCLTLGLFNVLIDVGLLYGCAYLIADFAIESVAAAALTALMINVLRGVVGGFK